MIGSTGSLSIKNSSLNKSSSILDDYDDGSAGLGDGTILPPKNSKYKWILDPGHGGMIDGVYQTHGKRSPKWDDGTQYFEGVGNREIVDKLFQKCIDAGIDVVDIVDSQEDISLGQRVTRANGLHKDSKNCIYVSIHSNGFSKESANGYSIYTSRGKTKSDKIATVFINNMKESFVDHKLRKDTTDGDEDKEAQFYVLRKTYCPAILIENFFMTNKKECDLLLDPEFQDKIVECHFKSIKEIEQQILI